MILKHRILLWMLVLPILFFIPLHSLGLTNEASKKKVAAVNGAIITQGDFDREIIGIRQKMLSKGTPLSEAELSKIRYQVLESLINRELLYQESLKKGVRVKEETIEKEFSALKGRFPSDEQFNMALQKTDLSIAGLKSQIKRGLIIQQYINELFYQKVEVSPEDTKAYYDGHRDLFKQPEQVRASHILIKVDPQAKTSEKVTARKKIKDIEEKIRKGENFNTLARNFSEGPSSAKGGDLGYFKRGQMVPSFDEAAFGLKPGEVSDIVETRFGYHLIKMTDKRPEFTVAYDEVKEKLQQYLKQQKAQQKVDAYVKDLKENAKVERFLN